MAADESAERLVTSTLRKETAFDLTPSAEDRQQLADSLDLSALRKLSFSGTVAPEGQRDLRLTATLGATVVQPCVVTGEPVTTRIDVPVIRHYIADMPPVPEGDEVEMPEDDTIEELPDVIDFYAVMAEALSLAVPDFPRAPGLAPVDVSVTEPGKAPMSDDDAKPFAGLRDLRDKLAGED